MYRPLPASLSWRGNPITRRGFQWAAEVYDPRAAFDRDAEVIGRSTIEELQFARHPPDLRRLAALAGFERLRSLVFTNSHYAGRHLAPLFGATGGLEELTFADEAITPDGVAALCVSPLFGELVGLRFSRAGSKAGRALLDGLAATAPARLRDLALRDSVPTTNGIEMLVAGRLPPSLRALDLSLSRLNSERAVLLTTAGTLASLRVLTLAANQLGNAGATALFTSPHLAGLKVLDLSHCQVGDEALRALLDDSPLADGLNLLNLTGSPASAEMKQAVKDRMGDRVRL
jgi:hypothetical protein